MNGQRAAEYVLETFPAGRRLLTASEGVLERQELVELITETARLAAERTDQEEATHAA